MASAAVELVDGRDRQDRLALVDRLVGQRDLAVDVGEHQLAVSFTASPPRQVVGREDRLDARHGERRARVDARTRACGMRAQQQLAKSMPSARKSSAYLLLPGDLRDEVGRACSSVRRASVQPCHAFRMFSAPRISEVRILS